MVAGTPTKHGLLFPSHESSAFDILDQIIGFGKLLFGSEFQDSMWGSSHLKSAKSWVGIFVEISAISQSHEVKCTLSFKIFFQLI